MQCQLSDGAYLAQWALTGGSLPRESGEGDWKFGHNKFPVWEGEDLLRTTLPSDEIPQIFTSNLKHLICISFQHGEKKRDPAFYVKDPEGPCGEFQWKSDVSLVF